MACLERKPVVLCVKIDLVSYLFMVEDTYKESEKKLLLSPDDGENVKLTHTLNTFAF